MSHVFLPNNFDWMSGIVNFTLLFAERFLYSHNFFLMFVLTCNWLLESSLILLVLTCMIVCWVWNNVHLGANYTQWLRQGILEYPIQMLWIMDFPFWMVRKKYYFGSSMSTWNVPCPFFKGSFPTFWSVSSDVCVLCWGLEKNCLRICGALCAPSLLWKS